MKAIIKKIAKMIFGLSYHPILLQIQYIKLKIKGSYFGLNELDKKLEKYVVYDKGFYVELGANDGITQSNSLYFELKRGWKGILIEPSPHKYLLCKENRNSKNLIYCNACVDFNYSQRYVDIKYANLMTVSQNLKLDLEDAGKHIEDGKKHLKENEPIFEFGSVAITLNELLEKSNAPKLIDFLSLDVEGAELDVLKGIDFERYNFRFMLIEIRNFDRINRFLKDYNYRFIEKLSIHDYLFKYEV